MDLAPASRSFITRRRSGERESAATAGGTRLDSARAWCATARSSPRARVLHEDPRYERSNRSGFGPRLDDVVHNTLFIRTDDGGHRLAISRFIGAVTTGFVTTSWEPRRLRNSRHALTLSLAGLASYFTADFTEEFEPDVRQYVREHLRGR